VYIQESIFKLGREILEVGVVHLVVLERLLRMTTKKSRQLFQEKTAPAETKS